MEFEPDMADISQAVIIQIPTPRLVWVTAIDRHQHGSDYSNWCDCPFIIPHSDGDSSGNGRVRCIACSAIFDDSPLVLTHTILEKWWQYIISFPFESEEEQQYDNIPNNLHILMCWLRDDCQFGISFVELLDHCRLPIFIGLLVRQLYNNADAGYIGNPCRTIQMILSDDSGLIE
jgi:hypothetical protein